ncbi:MAG TPA: glycosyltransferase [Bacteroidia bacterium]|nr:glycosyltransferase [Bacteroidia bacterium]
MNIALFLVAVPDLKGGGGAERQFCNFYEYFNSIENHSKNKLYLITDKDSLKNLKNADILKNLKNVIVLQTYQFTYLNFLNFVFQLFRKRIHLLHLVNTYTHHDFNLIYKFKKLQPLTKVKLSINNEVAELIDDLREYNKSGVLMTRYMNSIKILLENIQPSGVYTWYKVVADELKKSNLVNTKKCVVKNSEYCFTDLRKFVPLPNKQNHVVYASRLCIEKNPLLMVEAVKYLKENYNNDISNYKFLVYGRGELTEEMKSLINRYELNDYFTLDFSSSMHDVFGISKIFISTQPIENFTSLSMLEAMACGNVIIAKNVGQTDLFVKEGKNGFLYEGNDYKNVALAIRKAILLSDTGFKAMSQVSVDLATNHHNVKNFSDEIELFFEEVVDKS